VSKYLDSFIQEQKGRHFNEKLDNSSSNLKNLHDAVDLTRDQMEMIDVIINPGSITNGLFKKMNIYRLFERVSKLMRAKAEDKNVNITWHSHDQIKDTYCYNSIQFIPLILLDNAIKYSSKGKAIRIYFDVINSVSIQIRVSSFGRTVPSDEADKIFKKFIQGSNSKAYSSGGMGVGLWVLSKIVEAHDGFIKYENDESEFGVNNFIVTLPYLTENPVVVTAKSAKNAKRRFWS
jgi:signal transduction histidine kinase